ncbi:sulfatase family protein [Salegentibacter salegens]|uniref:Arylsulfatase A n=1 Tax=Salegentibacter salegens TaxID=143223 RepID=A0A1M7NP52_9FLAO|nr:arylsulfatase [Salegentibacter salegens]PRX43078.1 arylsulfatase A-like enzyme [Salegentibacter salegens]SHN05604.1 Arylsulfatase A [Salegentibacter salegens]
MKIYLKPYIYLLIFNSLGLIPLQVKSQNITSPNIVLIYADDLGYGDISNYGGYIPTPHIDNLAKNGLKFTNAYAAAATCTPSRYAMLTGEYAWRKKGTGVAPGDATSLILPGSTTLPGVLQKAGYKTAVVGKWHLGLGKEAPINWNKDIKPGPLEIGFDYAYLLPATGDRVPTVFVENHRVVNLDPKDPIIVSYRKNLDGNPTGDKNPEQLKMMYSHGHNQSITNGISRIGYMSGGEKALWQDEDIADILIQKSIEFLKENKNNPFFLFLSTHDIHVPRVPHERFAGVTGKGPRGDVIVQLDHTVGAIEKALEKLNLEENTLIIFTSDNGPVLDDGYLDGAKENLGNHNPFGQFRGGKYSAYQAGTRIPLIVKWKGKISPGSKSSALISQVDFLRSFAALTSQNIAKNKAIDSQNQWKALIGEQAKARKSLVQQAIRNVLSYVEGDYKYIEPHSGPTKVPWGVNIETGFKGNPQLYNLRKDPGETENLVSKMPEKMKKMKEELKKVRNSKSLNITNKQ